MLLRVSDARPSPLGWAGAALRPRTTLVAATVLLLAAATALGLLTDRLADGARVSFETAPRLASLPDYGESGSDVLGYDHGEQVRFTLALRNRAPISLELHDIDPLPERLGLLEVEDATVDGRPVTDGGVLRLGPFEQVKIAVTARFDNCEYYTERAVGRYDAAQVTVQALGTRRREAVAFDQQLLVRAPTILGCPDRDLDRSARQRSEDASIRG